MRIPRIVIAGVASGVGKTTVTVGIAEALRARGLRVATFKCGPDYLDPTYHRRASGRIAHNLDGFMMGRDAVLETFARATADADIALVEGVMGLFDGASPTGEAGSTAEIAKWLAAPVVLVVDASGMARSIAAIAHGFSRFDPDLRVEGVIGNFVGSRGHLELLGRALHAPPVLGGFPKAPEHAFPERHLGLRTADGAIPDALLATWGELAQAWLDLDRLVGIAEAAIDLELPSSVLSRNANEAVPRCRIAIARDEAFHFYYEANLARLEAAGAELVPFSMLDADRLPPDVAGLYLGGGYPELFADRIAANVSMRNSIRRFAADGHPIYAECGGLMALCRSLRTLDGERHAMIGLVPADVEVRSKLQALGYVEVETQSATALGEAGTRFRGHQFRYSELVAIDPDLERVYRMRRRRGGDVLPEGYRVGSVLASYVHAHWASNALVAENFVRACLQARPEAR